MSLVRASIRTERLEKEDNLFFKKRRRNFLDPPIRIEGHELDWISLEVARRSKQKTDLNLSICYRLLVLSAQKFPLESIHSRSGVDMKAATKVITSRARLAQLTGLDHSLSIPNTNIWDDGSVKVRKAARNLSRAIEQTTQLLFDLKAVRPVVLRKDWRQRSRIFWAIEVSYKEEAQDENTIIRLAVERDDASNQDSTPRGAWAADTSELEAILGLWLWALRLNNPFMFEGSASRIMSTDSKDEGEFNLWRDTGHADMRETTITRPILRTNTVTYQHKSTLPLEPDEESHHLFRKTFFGLYVLPMYTEGKLTILETPLGKFSLITCAQELYGLFLVSILQALEDIGGQTGLDNKSGRLVNDNVSSLLSTFTSNDLGSTEDAFSCIVPALKAGGHLPKAHGSHLRASIDAGLQETAMNLVKVVPNPDLANKNNWTPLMSAASRGYGNIVEALLGTGKVDGWKALRASVLQEDYVMAETLLKIGHVHPDPDPERLWDHRSSLLQLSAEKGLEDITDLLLYWEASPDVRDERGWTPLCVAVGKGHQEIARKLIQTDKVDVNLRCPDGRPNRTLLQVAIEGGFDQILRDLLNTGKILGVDARDEEGYTPLLAAAGKGQEETVKLLLATGRVDPKATTVRGWTPLTIALDKGFSQVAEILINTKKVDLNAAYPTSRPGRSLLQAVIEAGFDDVAELLIANPEVFADREARDGWSPLLAAAERGQTHLVQLLLDRDVDPSVKHERGWTPLSVAVDKGYSETVEFLLKTGRVDPNDRHPDSLASMVQVATDGGFEDTVRILLEVGKADPDVKSRDSWTPLGRAMRWGKERIVAMLLETGRVDISYRSPKGESLLELAERSRNKEVIRLIKEATEQVPDSQKQEVKTEMQKPSV